MIYALLIIIIFVAFLGQSLFGFGGGLISIPLLSLILPIQDAISIALIFQLLMGLIIFKNWGKIPLKIIRPLGLGLFIGTLSGIALLTYAPSSFLRLILLISIFLFLIRAWLFKELSFPYVQKPIWATAIGTIGGFIQGALGTGGPIFVIYLKEALNQKSQFRIAVIFVLFASNVLRLFIAAPTGLLSLTVLKLSLIALPFFLLALKMGEKFHVKLSAQTYRKCIELLLFISALSLGLKFIL